MSSFSVASFWLVTEVCHSADQRKLARCPTRSVEEGSRELKAFVASCVQWRDADTRHEPGQPSPWRRLRRLARDAGMKVTGRPSIGSHYAVQEQRVRRTARAPQTELLKRVAWHLKSVRADEYARGNGLKIWFARCSNIVRTPSTPYAYAVDGVRAPSTMFEHVYSNAR